MKRFDPILYRLKVKPDDVEETDDLLRRAKAAGLEIIKDAKDREQLAGLTGIVVGIGESAFEGNFPFEVGDRILYAKYGGIVFREEGIEYRFLNDEDIIAVEKEVIEN